jgi:RNA recognition motif-containing protein
MNIQVTNLNINMIETDLQRLFTPFGEIISIEILRDKINHRSRGKAVVAMPVEKEAQNAIVNLNGVALGGKSIMVSGLPNDEPVKRVINFIK